jgi:hypothetical protein
LSRAPAIAQSPVIGVSRRAARRVGKAFVVLRPHRAADAPQIIAWMPREHGELQGAATRRDRSPRCP